MVALEPLVERGWLAIGPARQRFPSGRVDFPRCVPWRDRSSCAAQRGFAERATPAKNAPRSPPGARPAAGWLDDYVLFMALETNPRRPLVGLALPLRRRDRWRWPRHAAAAGEIAFWQLRAVVLRPPVRRTEGLCQCAGRVALMGDLPIFVAHHSADCWARPDLYDLDDDGQPTVVAGVPPDALGPRRPALGQPAVPLGPHGRRGYAWWVARVRRALQQADVVPHRPLPRLCGLLRDPGQSAHRATGRWLPGPGLAAVRRHREALGELPIVAEDLGLITADVVELREAAASPA
jgi:4-alpha-glucanotransferase